MSYHAKATCRQYIKKIEMRKIMIITTALVQLHCNKASKFKRLQTKSIQNIYVYILFTQTPKHSKILLFT